MRYCAWTTPWRHAPHEEAWTRALHRLNTGAYLCKRYVVVGSATNVHNTAGLVLDSHWSEQTRVVQRLRQVGLRAGAPRHIHAYACPHNHKAQPGKHPARDL